MMADPTSHLIATILKNSREALHVEVSEFKGHHLLQLRVWANKEDGAEIPTKSGFGLRVALIPALRRALDDAETKARELGWLTNGQA